MARSRSRDPIDDRDDDLQHEDAADDMENAFPRKSSPLPWLLLIIVIIFSAAAGYLGYTKLVEQQDALVRFAKDRDAAKAKVAQMEAENAGLKKESETYAKQVSDLSAQLKAAQEKGATASADGTKPAGGDDKSAESAKSGTKGKTTTAKATSSKKKKSSRR